MQRPRRARLSLNKMIPNMLTLIALSSGLTAIRFAYEARWEHAVLAILVAAILDGLDGRIARLMKGTSRFGAELDSLSDFVCFGVAPPFMLYFWTLDTLGRFGWLLVLAYAVSMVLRLARFNTAIDDAEAPAWATAFFTGVPAPAGAGLVLLPMILSFQVGETVMRNPELVAAFLIVVAALLVSRLPTYSLKKVKLTPPMILPVMLGIGITIASLMSVPWLTLSIILFVYLISFPFSYRSYRAMERRLGARAAPGTVPDDDDDLA